MDHENFSKYLSAHEIEQAVSDVAAKINADYQDEPLLLIVVLKGAFVFASDLIRHLHPQTEIEFVRLSSYGRGRESSGTVTIIKDIQSDIRNRNVLIIEEIIDSGRTLRFLYDRVKASQPKSVEIVTLLDKVNKRVADVPVKYVGKETSDQFLVGYGLDLEEKSRNLKDIYYLKYPN